MDTMTLTELAGYLENTIDETEIIESEVAELAGHHLVEDHLLKAQAHLNSALVHLNDALDDVENILD